MRVQKMIERQCQANARRMLTRWGVSVERYYCPPRKTTLWVCDGKAWLMTKRRVALVGPYFEYLDRLIAVHWRREETKR